MSSKESHEGKSPETDSSESSISRIPVKRFGPYNLIGRLGVGGMAEVFLAYTAGPGDVRKLVVVKRLHRHLRDTKNFVRMFLDEARLAAQLSHPNIVQTYELGEIDGSYFISMEYLQGQSFDRILQLEGERDPKEWNQIVAQVLIDALSGLQYAHEFKNIDGNPLNIIHRDISPQNIFVSYEGMSKILDFGVAKAASQLDSTESGILKGKCSYVAPEQAYGEKIDQRADLWAMGVVLWEGLVGRRLFKAETNAATLLEVLTAEIPLVMDLSPHVPLTLGQVVEKALQRNPKNRYTTAAQMRADLEQYLKEVPQRITRQQAGQFVSNAFEDIYRRQQKVVEECLADALVSRQKKSKIRGPLPAHLPTSSSNNRINSLEANHRSSHPPSSKPRSSQDENEILRKSRESLPVIAPMANSESMTPHSIAPGPQQTTRQKIVLGAIALVLATIAATISALLYQHFVGQHPSDVHRSTGNIPVETAVEETGSRHSGGESSTTNQTVGNGNTSKSAHPSPEIYSGANEPDAFVRESAHKQEGKGSTKERNPPRSEVDSSLQTPSPLDGGQEPAQDGFLSLDTTPWTKAFLGDRELGMTPLIRVPLPPGTHQLVLRNEEQNINSTYRVVIRSGETTVRRLGLR